MIYKKAFESKFILPIVEEGVKFFRTQGQYGLVHIKVPRKSDDDRSVCGILLNKTKPTRDPSIIAEVCARCLKGQYSYFEQDLPFDTYLYVDYFNNLARQDKEIENGSLNIDFASILEKQLEYEIEAIKAQNEIRRCTHNYLFYLMRYNKIYSLECHNCHQEIIMDDCSCDTPIIIDFVDTNEQGHELNRDTFCIKCQGYVLSNLNHLK